MGRKKHAEEHENLERWLVSYADFITLLFALFVVLYALSQIDLAKFKQLKTSLNNAFNHSPTVLKGDAGMMNSKGDSVMDSGGFIDSKNIVPPVLDAVATRNEAEEFEKLLGELKIRKIDEIRGVKSRITERGLVINLLGNVFFETSASVLRQDSYETLSDLAKLLKRKFTYNLIRVEGHSDNMPINSEQYPSNWELSSARAAAIVRYFINIAGFEKDRFTVVGYADSRPIASNETEPGRKANRRVEIVVLRSRFLRSETQTYEFQKARLERLKRIEAFYRKKDKSNEGLSDAAKKLINNTKTPNRKIILYSDEYDEESGEMLKEIKEREQKRENARIKRQKFLKSVREEIKKQ